LAPVQEETKHSCCHRESVAKLTERQSVVERMCCQKSLARFESIALTANKLNSRVQLTAALDGVTTEVSAIAGLSIAPNYPRFWAPYDLPPPTNLVITLQHFVI
jgi:hypothetical protein